MQRQRPPQGARPAEGGQQGDPMSETVGAIDAWATLVQPGTLDRWPPEFISIFERYGSLPLFERGMTTEEMIDNMDAAGVDRLMLSAFGYGEYHIITERRGSGDLRKASGSLHGCWHRGSRAARPMDVVREIERLSRELGLRGVRLEPYAYGDGTVGAATE